MPMQLPHFLPTTTVAAATATNAVAAATAAITTLK